MRSSLIIISFFVAGLLLAYWGVLPEGLADGDLSMYALYLLMFLVGISIGSDMKALRALKEQHWRILLVPLATILGTLGGSALVSLFLPGRTLWDCLAVGSGFGYYSLSSVFITEYRGAELGTVALVANIVREIITLLGAPLLVCWFGRLAPICSGGSAGLAGLRQFVQAGRRRWIRRFPLSVAFPERSLLWCLFFTVLWWTSVCLSL